MNTDLTIQRNGGDALSLMTEIVMHSKPHTKLFDDPEKIRGGAFSGEEKSSFCTSISLSQVNEQHSEMESQQTTPNIVVIKDDDLSRDNIIITTTNNQSNSANNNERRITGHQASEDFLTLPKISTHGRSSNFDPIRPAGLSRTTSNKSLSK